MIEIIAEIGVNHNGSFDKAHTLIESARLVGCDTVKFQLFHGDRYPELQLTADQLSDLRQFTLASEMKFLCTPDDAEDAAAIKRMGCDRIKIGSSNVTNIPLLKQIAVLGMDVVLSTGAATGGDVDTAVSEFGLVGVPVTILHCVSAYPAPVGELNLSLIRRYARRMNVGYSDHTIGSDYQSALVALGLGARVFEKHFTLGHWMKGPDHKMSADLHEMKTYVNELRMYAAALGDGDKRVMPCEGKNRVEYERFVEGQHAHSSEV